MSISEPFDPQIEIQVETNYLPDRSNPNDKQFVFAYTITIQNKGQTSARLMSRRWVISDAEGNEQVVEGDGVVGKQPYIQPGERFQYTSGAMLPTPVGYMHGSYQLISPEGQVFDADIPAFSLSLPNTLH